SELRYLRVRHVDAKGREKQGELVCHQSIAADLLDIFRELYRQRYPIEKIRLIDCYDADDERSMSDNNSSCFCYRKIAGQRHLSKHARGMAVDINTLYNPCVRRRPDGTLHVQPAAGAAYADRSRTSPYRIVRGDLLHRLFLKHGFRWGGAWRSVKDYQHFEK
ncbi:MAG: M15 family metallopeptidase, partial [Prevotella sp.]|nr:M15 family metallopeptidase [Prevotella sp.]